MLSVDIDEISGAVVERRTQSGGILTAAGRVRQTYRSDGEMLPEDRAESSRRRAA